MRKFATLLTTFGLVLSGSLLSPANASTVSCGGGGTFTITGEIVTAVSDDCDGVVTIPEGVAEFDYMVFDRSEVTEFVLPSSFVGFYADMDFSNLQELTKFTVSSSNANYSADSSGVLFNKDKTTVLLYPQGKTDSSYSIPWGVQRIEDSSFSEAQFTSVQIPGTVTSIGISAFIGSSLTSVVIPASVTTLQYYAFRRNTNLSSVTFAGDPPGPAGNGGWYVFMDVTATVNVSGSQTSAWTTKVSEWNDNDQWTHLTLSISTANSNTVTFKSNYTGGATDTTQSITTDVATNLTSNSFSRTGYTFAGWTANADGTGTSYTGTQSVTLTGGLTLYAKWTRNSAKAGARVKPTVSGTAKVSNTLTAKKGTWSGYPTPALTYQWYACTKKVTAAKATVPSTCKKITGATKSKLKLAKGQKGKFISVLVTGKGTGTTATKWLSKSTAIVK